MTLHDAGRSADDASFFIVMEYVEGSTLRQSLARGPLPPDEAARVGAQIADALHYAHERGIVHRDVKPANILIRGDGVAKLADFGIARMESSEITRTGQSMGSPAYMSPEQALGRAVDARSDIFSLGVVLYEMLTGRKPFDGDTLAVICFKIVSTDPISPSKVNPATPQEWDALVMKALAKKPEERFPSAAGVAAELRRLAGIAAQPALGAMLKDETSPSRGAGSGGTLIEILEPPRRPARRRALIVIGVAAALLAAGVIVTQLVPRLMPHATVNVELSHGLRTGEIVLEVDGKEYWRQTVVGSDEGGFKEFTRKITGRGGGHAAERLRLAAGEHTFTVTVTSGDESWHDSERRRLFAGGAETLSVKVRTGLNRGMELEWK